MKEKFYSNDGEPVSCVKVSRSREQAFSPPAQCPLPAHRLLSPHLSPPFLPFPAGLSIFTTRMITPTR